MTKTVRVPLTAAQQERLGRSMRAGRGQVLKITKTMAGHAANSAIVVVDSDAKKIARAQVRGVGYTVEAIPVPPNMSGGFLDPISAGVASTLIASYATDKDFRNSTNKTAKKAGKQIKKAAKKVGKVFGFGDPGTHEYLEAVHGPAAMDRAYRGTPKRKHQKRDGAGLFLPHQSGRGLFLL